MKKSVSHPAATPQETRYVFLPDHDRDYLLVKAAATHTLVERGPERAKEYVTPPRVSTASFKPQCCFDLSARSLNNYLLKFESWFWFVVL